MLGAEYPCPNKVNLFNHGRNVWNPKRLKVTYSATNKLFSLQLESFNFHGKCP